MINAYALGRISINDFQVYVPMPLFKSWTDFTKAVKRIKGDHKTKKQQKTVKDWWDEIYFQSSIASLQMMTETSLPSLKTLAFTSQDQKMRGKVALC